MIIINRHVSEFGNAVMPLGYVGENEHTRVVVDCSSVFSEYPDAVPAMTVQPPAGNAYPAVTRREGNDVIWDVVDSDLAMAGDGKIQLTFTENTKIVKSCIGYTRIHHSLLPKNKIPTPIEDWLVEANTALNGIPQTIDNALEDAKESGEFDGPPGPKGDKGDPGPKGDTGDAFTYEDFTPEQLAGLVGPKGDKGDPGPKGDTGDAFTYEDFTPEQLAGLVGPKGDKGDKGDRGDKGDTGPQGLRGKTGVQGPQGEPGKDFHIAKTFSSISEMQSYTGTDVKALDFVMIDTGSVQDPDTGKLYCYDPDKLNKWRYIGDLSGAQGIKGEKGDKGDPGDPADPTDLIDDSSTALDMVWSSHKTNELCSALNSALNALPNVMHDDSNANLDITDGEGYVLARFQDGHFSTKNFDSSSAPAVRSTTKTGIPLDIVDGNGYVILRLTDGHIKTKNFDSAEASVGFEYKFSGDDLLIGYGYNDTDDAVVVMNCGRANGLFDFAGLKTKPKGTSLKNLETADLTTVWSSGTDMHGPFQFLANQNADGYHSDATSAGFVGGNHTLDQMGSDFKTAESVYVEYFADGISVSSGYGRATKFEVRWANDVQAYNTVKQGGGGRACLREVHDMIFDGVRFNERITLIPLESITMSLWYGLQCVAIGSVYTNIAFVDATNRQIFASSDSDIQSGNSVTSGFIGFGDDHRIEMSVDTVVDLGKRTYYSGNRGAFVSSTKGYFFIIGQNVTMGENTTYYLDGSFRFMPTISE